jgi:hypothetical protein
LEICKLQSSYMFKVALATTVCYDKSCINYKKLEIKTLHFAPCKGIINHVELAIDFQIQLNIPGVLWNGLKDG